MIEWRHPVHFSDNYIKMKKKERYENRKTSYSIWYLFNMIHIISVCIGLYVILFSIKSSVYSKKYRIFNPLSIIIIFIFLIHLFRSFYFVVPIRKACYKTDKITTFRNSPILDIILEFISKGFGLLFIIIIIYKIVHIQYVLNNLKYINKLQYLKYFGYIIFLFLCSGINSILHIMYGKYTFYIIQQFLYVSIFLILFYFIFSKLFDPVYSVHRKDIRPFIILPLFLFIVIQFTSRIGIGIFNIIYKIITDYNEYEWRDVLRINYIDTIKERWNDSFKCDKDESQVWNNWKNDLFWNNVQSVVYVWTMFYLYYQFKRHLL